MHGIYVLSATTKRKSIHLIKKLFFSGALNQQGKKIPLTSISDLWEEKTRSSVMDGRVITLDYCRHSLPYAGIIVNITKAN